MADEDKNNSTQQSLPLSWDEGSQQNIEQQIAPKKMILKREGELPSEPKTLLMKKPVFKDDSAQDLDKVSDAADDYEDVVSDHEYRRKLDKFDTIYDELNNPEDSNNEEDGEQVHEDFNFESENQLNRILAQEDEHEDEMNNPTVLDPDPTAETLSAEEIAAATENESSSYEFQDSGTFTLGENEVEEDLQNDEAEDNSEENSSQSNISANDSNNETSSNAEKKILLVNSQNTASRLNIPEESVFALKADTYYDVHRYASESDLHNSPQLENKEVIRDEITQSFGALLQEARLACNFTIKDAADKTRIKSGYIVSLENNEFDNLPPKVYVMNYIRQLCREYNTPSEPILKAFESFYESEPVSEHSFMAVGNEDARKATTPDSKLNTILVGSGLLVLLVLFLLGYYMRWLSPTSNMTDVKVDVKLEEIKPPIGIPAPELPIPSR